jgi:hypothetical protein
VIFAQSRHQYWYKSALLIWAIALDPPMDRITHHELKLAVRIIRSLLDRPNEWVDSNDIGRDIAASIDDYRAIALILWDYNLAIVSVVGYQFKIEVI